MQEYPVGFFIAWGNYPGKGDRDPLLTCKCKNLSGIESMKSKPKIIVQLVHIEGPFKGEIQELTEDTILIGRHPSCHVKFPVDYATISRKHATIVREGNRFKFKDQSTNGTFINGKKVKEAILKDGDVLIFAKGGPKVSFLTQVTDTPLEEETEYPIGEPEISQEV